MKIITVAQMKAAEAYAARAGIAPVRLMENAGSAAARLIRGALSSASRCAVVCGSGNNGGDGFVVARRLADSCASVSVILACGLPRTPQASEMYDRLGGLHVAVSSFVRDKDACLDIIGRADVIVDAVFGTGFHGAVDEGLRPLFARINASEAPVYALDMPSGAQADTGEVSPGCIEATQTITFAAAKTGQFIFPAAGYCGKIMAVEIGIPEGAFSGCLPTELLEMKKIRETLPRRAKDSHKGTYGKVLAVCGSRSYPGAAYMSATAAARCGAGLVTVAAPKSIWAVLTSKFSEVMVTPLEETADGAARFTNYASLAGLSGGASALLIGCGLSRSEEAFSLVRSLVRGAACPVVLDADGINAFDGHINVLRESGAALILTPHPGEMAGLTGMEIGRIQSDRLGVARDFAQKNGVILVLKGANTVVASPDGRLLINPTGNPGMARGGSGDILAGMIAGFAAQGIEPLAAACCGVYLHGLAGDRCAEKLSQYGMLPTDMLTELPQIFREMSR